MIHVAVLVAGALAASVETALAQTRVEPAAVLHSVDRWLPPLLKAAEDVRAAAADAGAARGAFDFTLKADAISERGAYDNEQVRLTGEQPLAWQGLNTYGGYRLGRGAFAPYDGKAQTLSEGELAGGVSLPLLRDRAIDARRTDLRLTALGIDAAGAALARQRLSVYRDALMRYWDAAAAVARRHAVAVTRYQNTFCRPTGLRRRMAK